jgi:hypothetical protein
MEVVFNLLSARLFGSAAATRHLSAFPLLEQRVNSQATIYLTADFR